jgi:hypothetical protein
MMRNAFVVVLGIYFTTLAEAPAVSRSEAKNARAPWIIREIKRLQVVDSVRARVNEGSNRLGKRS